VILTNSIGGKYDIIISVISILKEIGKKLKLEVIGDTTTVKCPIVNY
jgi:hypothetical protein